MCGHERRDPLLSCVDEKYPYTHVVAMCVFMHCTNRDCFQWGTTQCNILYVVKSDRLWSVNV